jgi:hypothetical protein
MNRTGPADGNHRRIFSRVFPTMLPVSRSFASLRKAMACSG